jgi:hypothetical protein
MPLRLSAAVRNIRLNRQGDELDNGYLRIYDGAQPDTPETAVGAQVLLAELRFANPADGADATGGVMTLSAITDDASANATGTAAWFRALKADGTTAVFDGTVGTTGANINFNTVAFVSGALIEVTSFEITDPME